MTCGMPGPTTDTTTISTTRSGRRSRRREVMRSITAARGNEPPTVVLTDLMLFNRSVRVGEAVRGRVILERPLAYTDAVTLSWRDDVAAGAALDLLHLVRVHAHQAPDLVLLAGARVDDLLPLRERALVDAQVGELPEAGVVELERERHDRQ